jgi:hypothetical protein
MDPGWIKADRVPEDVVRIWIRDALALPPE